MFLNSIAIESCCIVEIKKLLFLSIDFIEFNASKYFLFSSCVKILCIIINLLSDSSLDLDG